MSVGQLLPLASRSSILPRFPTDAEAKLMHTKNIKYKSQIKDQIDNITEWFKLKKG